MPVRHRSTLAGHGLTRQTGGYLDARQALVAGVRPFFTSTLKLISSPLVRRARGGSLSTRPFVANTRPAISRMQTAHVFGRQTNLLSAATHRGPGFITVR